MQIGENGSTTVVWVCRRCGLRKSMTVPVDLSLRAIHERARREHQASAEASCDDMTTNHGPRFAFETGRDVA
jgi:hypothetical protein